MNDNERNQWIDNDEGLYNWFTSSNMSRRTFLRTHRKEIDDIIKNITSGAKPAHYLTYGD